MFNIKGASRGCTMYPKYVTYAQRHARNFHPMLQRALPTKQHLNDNNFSSRSRLYSQTHTLFKPAVHVTDLNSSKNNKNCRTETPTDNSLVGLTGGQIFHEMMIRNNVDTVFGYPGGAILPVYDAIHESKAFTFILPKHEQGAGHMAEGYTRASGKPGVVLVTSGPGATNVVTPLADALSDGIPLVVFTGQVATSAIGSDAFQEADVLGITRPCTKWNVMVRNIEELSQRINEAFRIATSGRPGPVLVDLPKDVTAGILRQKAAQLINSAKKPVFFVGGGILNNEDGPRVLKELSERANIPVMTTLQGLGSFDQEDPKSLDMVGMHGSAVANLAMQNADLVIAVGARFDDRVTGNLQKFAPAAREASLAATGGIIQFDINPKNINKVVQTDVAIEGDAANNLKKLLPMVFPIRNRTEWFDEINSWKQKYPYNYMKETKDSKIKPQTVISRLSKIANSTGR
ncbi:Acetolactate synthase, mitochondrial [Maudiozyma exigua]|uniref:acetolactate synthase n=1 Tax=Maudiozyma exigua TaxID=34358 RepID=A0A9P6WCA4_MAUEX|nr:Acetolactate synthase, mitochondrial [Kazachstania exigua]